MASLFPLHLEDLRVPAHQDAQKCDDCHIPALFSSCSSFHRYVKLGWYDKDWGKDEPIQKIEKSVGE